MMANWVASVLQTGFAAVSFAGAGYLFKMIDKGGYEEEMKRHDLALEKFDRDKERFYEEEVREHDREEALRREIDEANADMNRTNESLDNLSAAKREYDKLMRRRVQELRRPKLSSYYTPSGDMRYYQSMAAAMVGVGCGIGAFYYGFPRMAI